MHDLRSCFLNSAFETMHVSECLDVHEGILRFADEDAMHHILEKTNQVVLLESDIEQALETIKVLLGQQVKDRSALSGPLLLFPVTHSIPSLVLLVSNLCPSCLHLA